MEQILRDFLSRRNLEKSQPVEKTGKGELKASRDKEGNSMGKEGNSMDKRGNSMEKEENSMV